jgi:hypothetical protein
MILLVCCLRPSPHVSEQLPLSAQAVVTQSTTEDEDELELELDELDDELVEEVHDLQMTPYGTVP